MAVTIGRWRTASVGFARIELVDEHPGRTDIGSALSASIVPGTSIERYERLWRMGQVRREDDAIIGRIGYERAGDVAELWDPEIGDFARTRLREGFTSPFVIRPDQLTVAFQLRAGRIRPTSFTGAFQALLNEKSPSWRWRVVHLIEGVGWEEWTSSVSRVKRLEIRLERPNPNYHGRHEVERIIEGAEAKLAKLILEARDDDLDGLALDDPLIREAIEHALEDWGSVKAVAEEETATGAREVQWRSDVEGVPVQGKAEIDQETREAQPDALKRELDKVVADDPPGGDEEVEE